MQNLTPIKIPGKRAGIQKQSTRKNNERHAAGRSGSGGSPSSSQKSVSRKVLNHVKPAQNVSSLEKLPVELLQKIFIDSLNDSLLRASPIIAAKLMCEHTFVQTILGAFSPTWKYRYNCIKERNPYVDEDDPGDVATQSAILSARWASLHLLRKTEDIWLSPGVTKSSSLPQGIPLPGMYSTLIENATVSDPALDSGEWRKEAEGNCFDQDYSEFRVMAGGFRDPNGGNSHPPWKWEGFLKLHPDTDIPDHLLSGPWTEETVKHLFWFLRAGARVRDLWTTSGEVAEDGLRAAISAGSLEALYMLDCLGLTYRVDAKMVEFAFENVGGNKLEVLTRIMSMCSKNSHDFFERSS